ncbi:MAG: helix-turn-helix transcriptional regulator [Candidatus Sedimenticola sp. (ex Thyasira tokunagai)]
MTEQLTTYSALLGQIVGSLRQRQRLEQLHMANALGLSQASYSRLEGGKALWSIDQLMVVARALEVPVTDIIQILEQRAADLHEAADVEVIAAGRANSRGGEANKSNTGAILAGAALGALLTTLIMKK